MQKGVLLGMEGLDSLLKKKASFNRCLVKKLVCLAASTVNIIMMYQPPVVYLIHVSGRHVQCRILKQPTHYCHVQVPTEAAAQLFHRFFCGSYLKLLLKKEILLHVGVCSFSSLNKTCTGPGTILFSC